MQKTIQRGIKNFRIIRFLIVICILIPAIVFLVKFTKGRDEDPEEIAKSFVKELYASDKYYFDRARNLDNFEPFVGERLVHLDLKGAPPRISYLKEFIPFIRRLGATGLLIEYEDMFPYKGEIESIRSADAYTIQDIQEILSTAENSSLIVVPLIQTFSHLGYLLKLKEFEKLREVEENPEVLCPTHEKSYEVLEEMITQVLEAHPNADYIHLGCDSMVVSGKCKKCRHIMRENSLTAEHLFLNHIRKLGMFVKSNRSTLTPIVWGDTVMKLHEDLIKDFQIPKWVDLMVRNEHIVDDKFTYKQFVFLAKLFKEIWIATAYKGFANVNTQVTDGRFALSNHLSWMTAVSDWKSRIKFKGIALIGSQRFDHFSQLCELLPMGIPSLALNLQFLKHPQKGALKKNIYAKLKCKGPIPFSPEEISKMGNSYCDFPGHNIFQLICNLYKLYEIPKQMSIPWEEMELRRLSVYNIVYNSANKEQINLFFSTWPAEKLRIMVNEQEVKLTEALSRIYYWSTVREWITTNILGLRLKLDAIFNVREALLSRRVWGRGPISNVTFDLETTFRNTCSVSNPNGCALFIF